MSAVRRIDPTTAVDGLHPDNLGRVLVGDPRFVPCTPLGIERLLLANGITVEGADVAIVNDDLRAVEAIFELSSAAGRRIKQNLGWAFLYNGIAIPLAVTGFLNPLFAAAAMATSSLLVVSNSSRRLLGDSPEE